MSLAKEVKELSKKLDVGIYQIPLGPEPYIQQIQTGSNSWLCKLCYQVDGRNYVANINKEAASVLISTGKVKYLR